MPFLPPEDQMQPRTGDGSLRASRPQVALDPTAWLPQAPQAPLSSMAGNGGGQPFLPPEDVQPPMPPPSGPRMPFLPPEDFQPSPAGPVTAAPLAPTGNPNMQIGNMFGAQPRTGGNNVQPPMMPTNGMQTKPMAMAPASPFQRQQPMSDRRQMLARLLMRRNRGAF